METPFISAIYSRIWSVKSESAMPNTDYTGRPLVKERQPPRILRKDGSE